MNHNLQQLSDKELLNLLPEKGDAVIEVFFKRYYQYLCIVVMRMLSDKAKTEDLVQDVFYELWRKRESLFITTSLKAYLKRAAVNKTLNYFRAEKMKFSDNEIILPSIETETSSAIDIMETAELKIFIDQSIDALPPRCKMIFVLSRYEEMSHKEIAAQLDISVKTVENQISKALKLLRGQLVGYLTNN